MKKLNFLSCITASLCLLFEVGVAAQSPAYKAGYAPINGLKMYYEVHGNATGTPLVLVHGSYMNIPLNWAQLLPELSKTRTVIALELQGHGRTADTDRPYSYDAMADDVAALIKHLKYENADILGYSLGGSIAINTAIRHPEVVRKLVVVSAPANSEGWLPEVNAVIATIQPEFFEQTPLKTTYDELAPNPTNWKNFVSKLAKFETLPFDFDMEKVQKIQAPVLLVIGDSDGMVLEHAVALFKAWGGGVFGDMAGLPKSQLAVLPASTHVGLMMQTGWVTSMVPAFLDGAPAAETH